MKKIIQILTLIGFVFSVDAQTLSDSLQVHLDMSGNSLDISGNNNDGTVSGATLTSDRFGIPNSAYLFDGINDYISFTSDFDYEERTYQYWFEPHSIGTVSDCIFSSDHPNLDYGRTSASIQVIGGQNTMKWQQGGSVYQMTGLNTNQWYLATTVVTVDSTYFYQCDSLVATIATLTGTSSNGNSYASIGKTRVNDRFFHGKVDEFRVYNRALTASEITGLCGENNIINENLNFAICEDSVLSPSGNTTWYMDGIYLDTIYDALGSIDSIYTINLSFTDIDTAVLQTNSSLQAVMPGANYQWFNCDREYSPISGATNQSFSPNYNGSYAVVISIGNCVDTSDCILFRKEIGLEEFDISTNLSLHPNPTKGGSFTIELGNKYENISLNMYSIDGKLIRREHHFDTDEIHSVSPEQEGIYLLKIQTDENQYGHLKLINL